MSIKLITISNLLLEDAYSQTQFKNLQSLHHSSEYLLLLVNDILEYNKLETGNIQINQNFFYLPDLIYNLQNMFSPKTLSKQIDFQMLIDEDIPMIKGDSLRLGQILSNLLSNAIKFTEKGFVKLSIKIVEKDTDKIRLNFSVEDTGIGISEKEQERIFKDFSQANPEINKKFGGSGLGLAISKKLLQMMGSEFLLRTELGKGSSFSFDLTSQYRQRSLAEENTKKQGLIHRKSSLKGANILLVEDNEINQMVAKQFLEKWGATVEICFDGQEAFRHFRNKPENIQLILMDLQMPNMNGYQATKKLRELPEEWAKKVPIIALSASADFKHRITEEMGFTDFIEKPFQPETLFNKILQFISQIPANKQQEKVVDLSHYLSIAKDDYVFLEKLLEKIVEEFEKKLKDYKKAFIEENLQILRVIQHSLKPTLQVLKADIVYQLFQEGKDLLTDEESTKKEKTEYLQKLEKAFSQLIEETKILLEKTKNRNISQ